MSKKSPYTYVVLRYRHDALAGEFANAGVLLHAPTVGYLDARIRHTFGRISKMFPDIEQDAFKSAMRSIERGLKRLANLEGRDLLSTSMDAGVFAQRVLANDDGSFIWSSVGSGISDDPALALDKLYDRFVGLYDENQRPHRDDAAVWKPIRDKLTERRLADRLQPTVIHSQIDKVEFEHAWKNGAWHCYQPLSFDLANEENIREKARRWAGHMLALKGADQEFRPYFLVGSPATPNLHPAYNAALEILKLSPGDPKIIEERDFEHFVIQVEDEMRAHPELT